MSEQLFEEIVEWAHEASGAAPAFEWRYGEHTLNKLRREVLCLPELTPEDACPCGDRVVAGRACPGCGDRRPVESI